MDEIHKKFNKENNKVIIKNRGEEMVQQIKGPCRSMRTYLSLDPKHHRKRGHDHMCL